MNYEILICFLTPSTSQHCKKRSPKKSPLSKDQSTSSAKRRVYFVKDNSMLKKMTEQKITRSKKMNKRWINRKKFNLQKSKNRNSHSVSSTLEEGEIRSYVDKLTTDTSTITITNTEDDDDDCILIEPTIEEIIIDDNRDDNFPSTSDVSTNYQSLIYSFNKCDSSTPCQKKKSPAASFATPPNIEDENKNEVDKSKEGSILPFFVDLGRSIETINSVDNFSDYNKLSTLTEKSTRNSRFATEESELICLDDSSLDNTDVTLQRKPQSLDLNDDSVVFICETNEKDFIPIENDKTLPHTAFKTSEPTVKTPLGRLINNNLFTKSEKKTLNKYNENAYNPSAAQQLTLGKRMVILDGSNVAFKHGLDREFSVKGLQIAIEYFEKIGHEVKAVIPQFRMNKAKSTNYELLDRLHKAGKIVQTPCKNLPGLTSISYDDRFILQLAFEMDAAIVSNDNYRDLLHENPAFKKIIENRVIGYTWCNDIFILPKDPYGRWGPTLHVILNRF